MNYSSIIPIYNSCKTLIALNLSKCVRKIFYVHIFFNVPLVKLLYPIFCGMLNAPQ